MYNYPARNPQPTVANGTNSGAAITLSAVSTLRHHIYKVFGWSDTASLLTINYGGANPIELKIEANKYFDISFNPALKVATNTQAVITLITSTSDCSLSVLSESLR